MAALAMAAVVLVGQVPLLAREGEWSGSALHHHAFTEPGVGVAALVCVLVAAVSVALTALRLGRSLLAAYRLSDSLSPTAGQLVVLSGGPADAVAVPGRPGRVVMGESLRAALTANERRALVAHEQAHLEHGHHWHRVAVHLAAAANPLLAPLRGAIVHTTERWADEEAAKRLGDRRLVAATLARVALLSKRHVPAAGLAFAAHAVPLRAAALLAPPTRPRPLVTAALVAIPLAAMAAALLLMQQTDHVFDLAQRIYRLGQSG
jgi:Zn-dependent protease with chaperone function